MDRASEGWNEEMFFMRGFLRDSRQERVGE
jgi:hypothetical protein